MFWTRAYRLSRDPLIVIRGTNRFLVATDLATRSTAEMNAASLAVLSYFLEPTTPDAAWSDLKERLEMSEVEFAAAFEDLLACDVLELAAVDEAAPASTIVALGDRPDLISRARAATDRGAGRPHPSMPRCAPSAPTGYADFSVGRTGISTAVKLCRDAMARICSVAP